MSTIAVQEALTAPVAQRADRLLALKEDQWFDRKSARTAPRDLADCMIGMANAEGGTIIVGLHRDRAEGVAGRDGQINGWRQAALDFCVPPVRVAVGAVRCVDSSGTESELLVMDVDASEHVHANVRDEVFLRVGDENRKLTFAQRQELLYDKGQATFETTVVDDAVDEDLDQALLDSYAEAVSHPDARRLLSARGLISPGGEITAAGYLLFGSDPTDRFPEAYVRVLRYRGSERGTGARQQLLEEVRCSGPIPRLLLQARTEITALLPSRRALGSDGTFGLTSLIPEDAWLEGLVNAVVHRSYSLSGDHIRVEIFDDRVEIESPGRAPGLVNLRDPLNTTRFARNPRTARVCADLRFGQELGEGIRRMFEEMRLAGLTDPFYRETAGSVILTLSTESVDQALDAQLPTRSREILRLLREGRRLGSGEIVEAMGLSRPAVLSRLRALQKAGLIEWVGHSKKDPRAYWKLKIE